MNILELLYSIFLCFNFTEMNTMQSFILERHTLYKPKFFVKSINFKEIWYTYFPVELFLIQKSYHFLHRHKDYEYRGTCCSGNEDLIPYFCRFLTIFDIFQANLCTKISFNMLDQCVYSKDFFLKVST